MTFRETISCLHEKTDEIIVYAGQATRWIDGKSEPCIGIRSYFAGYDDNDPVVDGVSFMVCGTVYFSSGKEVTDIHDLNDVWTRNPDYYVMLRAVSAGYPITTIDLGRYIIQSKTSLDENDNVTMHLVRLH